MRKIIFIILISMSFGSIAHAYSTLAEGELIDEYIELVDIADWDNLLRELKIRSEITDTGNIDAKSLIKDIMLGKKKMNSKELLDNFKSILFKEIRYNYSLILQLIVIGSLYGIIANLTSSFGSSSIGDIAYFTCYIVIIVIILQNLLQIIDIGKRAIDNMVRFMHIISPSLIAFILMSGGITTASVLKPSFAFTLGLVGTLLKNTIIPLIYLSTVFTIISNLNQDLGLSRLNQLLKTICTWILGITFTVFVGVLVVQGVMATTFDGISVRTTKYAIESFVPVVGGLFSKTVDTVIGYSVIVKNAVGIAGLIIIIMICLMPCIKIFALMIIYKISSALIELISDKKIADCLYDISGIMSTLLVTVLGVAIVFFLTIAIMIAAGNAILYMR
ncbi:MAG: stage III sporulation protein AE [Clostridiales bacterium]|nr:stage III sporulation protein AE [Clostridiales bacterium]